MNRRKVLLSVILGFALAGMGLAWLLGEDQVTPTTAVTPATSIRPLTPPPAAAYSATPPAVYAVSLSAQDSEFIAGLREQFKVVIHRKHAQIKAIEQLIAYLMARYPEDWSFRLYAFLQQLFPELADPLYAQFQKLTQYNDWLRENREVLMRMSPQERRAALLAARRAAFGADAAEIWASEQRTARIQGPLAALNAAEGVPLDDKLASYVGAINEAYGDKAGAFVQTRQTELMNRFLAVESVQSDLHALSPAQRNAALRNIRRGMGMDEAALQRWDELDRSRDEAWDSGQRYRVERERIQKEYDGEDEARELQKLQEESFGAEAETVRAEEQSGFYRYSQRRRYGRE
ncbi:MAG: hypothetical protein ACRETN_13465 [Nevskiales bacterium]